MALRIESKVVTDEDIEAGAIAFTLPDVYTNVRDRWSIEIRPGFFQAYTSDVDDYINHSCDPNLALLIKADGVFFVALRDIKAGEEVTWDYETAEAELSNPFECHCGAEKCRGKITGYATHPFDKP